MERYCGFLKHALQSRSQPWRNLDERVKALAYRSQLKVKYDLKDELETIQRRGDDLSSVEHIYPECEYVWLLRLITKPMYMACRSPEHFEDSTRG